MLATGYVMGAVNVVTAFVPTLLLFYMVSTSVDSMKRFREVCLFLSAISVIIAVHGIEQVATEDGMADRRQDNRGTYHLSGFPE